MIVALVEMSWIQDGVTVSEPGICLGSSTTDIEAYIQSKAKYVLRDKTITTLTVEAQLYRGQQGWVMPLVELQGTSAGAAGH